MKLQKPTLNKRKLVRWALLAVVVVAAAFFIKVRGKELYSCYAAEYDLHRDTNFRFITGRCTATGKDGGQVYVDQLRAFGTDDHHDVDVDHGN